MAYRRQWRKLKASALNMMRMLSVISADRYAIYSYIVIITTTATTSSVTAVLPPPGQCCGTVCLNSFGNRTPPSENWNDHWKRLCLVSWAAAPCVWTLRALTRNLLTYLLATTWLYWYTYVRVVITVMLHYRIMITVRVTKNSIVWPERTMNTSTLHCTSKRHVILGNC